MIKVEALDLDDTGNVRSKSKVKSKSKSKTKLKSKPEPPPKPVVMAEIHKHRQNIREVLLCSNATPIRRFGDKGYACCYCDNQFHQPEELKKHTLETHVDVQKALFMKFDMERFVVRLDITGLRCTVCDQEIDTVEKLMEHLRMVHDKVIYTDIPSHITPLKFVSDSLQCCVCLILFSRFKMLLEHMNTHYRNHICNVCDIGFTYKSSLNIHMYSHKTGTFPCEHCPLIFETNAKRKVHERFNHSPKAPVLYKCAYCNETFGDYRKKEAHLVSMHGVHMPSPKCQACERVFKNRKLLNVHIKRDHLRERRHKCAECDMSFFQLAELKDHLVKHTGIKSFKCLVCLKPFSRAKSLSQHMKIHDDIKRFKCEYCGRAYVQKCGWRNHMRSKHGEIV